MTVAREYHQQMVHYLRKSISFADDDVSLDIGVIPAGALIHKAMSGVHVVTAFDGTTSNVLQIGDSADADEFGGSLALGTEVFVPLDIADGTLFLVTVDTTITCLVETAGTLTAGAAEVIICYIPDNDG